MTNSSPFYKRLMAFLLADIVMFFMSLIFAAVVAWIAVKKERENLAEFMRVAHAPANVTVLENVFAEHLLNTTAKDYAGCRNFSEHRHSRCQMFAIERTILRNTRLSPAQGQAALSVFANYGYPIPEAFREEAVLPLDQALAMLQDSPTVSR